MAVLKFIECPLYVQYFCVNFLVKHKNYYRLIIYSTQGKLVADRIINDGKILIERQNLKSGLYLFKLIALEQGENLSGKFIIK